MREVISLNSMSDTRLPLSCKSSTPRLRLHQNAKIKLLTVDTSWPGRLSNCQLMLGGMQCPVLLFHHLL